MFTGFLGESIVKRAVDKGACEIEIVDLREFGIGKYRKIDDKPYGGGPGCLMMCEPWFAAMEKVLAPGEEARVIMTTPGGRRFAQRDARELAGEKKIVFMCGHYEGFDERIKTLATDFYSIGDFVLTGGELPAACMVDSIVRLLPGVLGGGEEAVHDESFTEEGVLEAPQWTRPAEFRGMKVPQELLCGDHARIDAWRRANKQKI